MYYNKNGEKIIISNHNINSFLHVFMAGITYPNTKYYITHNLTGNEYKFIWDKYNFEYVISGKGYIEAENTRYTVEAGDFFFLNKLKTHVYYSDSVNPFTKMFVVLQGDYLDSLIKCFRITESVIIKKKNMQDFFSEFHELTTKDINSQEYFDKLTTMTLQLVKAVASINYVECMEKLSHAERIRAYIDEHIHEAITLQTLSDNLHLSKSHIERVFHEKYEMSPIKYATNKKVQSASILLVHTNISIEELSQMFSFYDAANFSKCFKKVFSISPTKYRKLNR